MIRQNLIFLLLFLFVNADALIAPTKSKQKSKTAKKDTTAVVKKPTITFIELGSVRCIPCKMMQPVMKSIEEKYREQVKVIFYDVRTAEQQQYAQYYGTKDFSQRKRLMLFCNQRV